MTEASLRTNPWSSARFLEGGNQEEDFTSRFFCRGPSLEGQFRLYISRGVWLSSSWETHRPAHAHYPLPAPPIFPRGPKPRVLLFPRLTESQTVKYFRFVPSFFRRRGRFDHFDISVIYTIGSPPISFVRISTNARVVSCKLRMYNDTTFFFINLINLWNIWFDIEKRIIKSL